MGLLLVVLLSVSCGKHGALVKNRSSGGALGTMYHITYISDRQLDYQPEIDSVFAAINHSMSTYIPGSDISKINDGDSTVVVDQMFRDVFELSKEVHDSTEGYFDPTVGVLVDAWGFGPGKQITLDSAKVDSLLDYVGFEKVGITDDNRITKSDYRIRFDFNAVAKGYAIDRLAAMLDAKGIANYLVEVGGEIVAKGKNVMKEKPWVVGIDNPEGKDRSKPIVLLSLENEALASSGNYRKFRIDTITGKKYVHTINPKTGYTKNSNVLGSSVIASNCAMADAYATAFMAMDLDDSIKLLVHEKDMEAFIVYLDEDGNVEEFMTDGFKRRLVE
ncbi:FAD:protein FMN transferase [Flavobacteriaceae bacterium F89]|uniref:FAD:protein FMN transferase n=1 Tax=Cerina litoralis TaxID=2874477 RepID=A0AAE3EU40_9FLAO|nr:FAD:protein FMN transferase [Cerina litoralis]